MKFEDLGRIKLAYSYAGKVYLVNTEDKVYRHSSFSDNYTQVAEETIPPLIKEYIKLKRLPE